MSFKVYKNTYIHKQELVFVLITSLVLPTRPYPDPLHLICVLNPTACSAYCIAMKHHKDLTCPTDGELKHTRNPPSHIYFDYNISHQHEGAEPDVRSRSLDARSRHLRRRRQFDATSGQLRSGIGLELHYTVLR